MKSQSIGSIHPSPMVKFSRGTTYHRSSIALLSVIYVFDEVLNGLLGTNFGGALLLLLWIGILTLQSSEILRLRSVHLKFYFVVVLASLIAYAAPSGCYVEAKGAMSLLFLGIVIALFQRMNLARIAQEDRIAQLILLLVLVLLILDTVGLGIRSMLFGVSKGSGAASEASHLALYLLPVIAVRILFAPKDKLAWIVLFATLALAPSLTLLIGILGALGIYLMMGSIRRAQRLWVLFGFTLIALGVAFWGAVDLSHQSDRISHLLIGFGAENVSHENLSSVVWLNGWSQAAETLFSSEWLGVGFNQMGCGPYYSAGFFSPMMLDTYGMVLNAEDGSLLAAKLIAELGVVGLGIVLIFSAKSVAAILSSRKTGAAGDPGVRLLAIIRAVGGLTVLMYFFVRGMGYFQIPLLLGIAMLLVSKTGHSLR